MLGAPRTLAALMLVWGLVLVTGCTPEDPALEVMRERARWTVEVRSFVVLEDGSSRVTVQVAGPVKSSLEVFTVRVELVDGAGQTLHSSWYPIDLGEIRRGVPAERTIPLPATSPAPESVQVDPIRSPTEQDIQHMPEMSDLAAEP